MTQGRRHRRPEPSSISIELETEKNPEPVKILTIGEEPIPVLPDLPVLDENPVPEYLRNGVEHPIIASLQQRLMDLGFMDNDEPTQYFGNMTESAVKTFNGRISWRRMALSARRRWKAIMAPSAKYYAVSKDVDGDDIKRIQNRLYELGYLAAGDLVTDTSGDDTEAAVIKLQEVNRLNVDGKVGQQTINPFCTVMRSNRNFLSYGEKSDVVLACQTRLKELGYLTTTPDGSYGDDTAAAVKQFQARNDLVVDGLSRAIHPCGLKQCRGAGQRPDAGEQGETVTRIQQLLNKYGYLSSANVTGYYGGGDGKRR